MGMKQTGDGETDLNEFLQKMIDPNSKADFLFGELTYLHGGKWVQVTVHVRDVEYLLDKRNALIIIADTALNPEKASRHTWIGHEGTTDG